MYELPHELPNDLRLYDGSEVFTLRERKPDLPPLS